LLKTQKKIPFVMQPVSIKKTMHKNEARIVVTGPCETWFNNKIRSIKGRTWSKTLQSWHIPDTDEALKKAKTYFPEAEIISTNTLTAKISLPLIKPTQPKSNQPEVKAKPVAEAKMPEKNIQIMVENKKIFVHMTANQEDIGFLKKIKFSHWDPKKQKWVLPLFGKNLEYLKNWFGERILSLNIENELSRQVIDRSHGRRQPGLMNFENEVEWNKTADLLILKGYSKATQRTYLNELKRFFTDLRHEKAVDFPVERISKYLIWCSETLHLTENTIHSRMNALKFYYEQLLKREKFFMDLPRPKKRQQLPKVISEEKILAGIITVENLKHRTLLLLAYSCSLRVSEAVGVQVSNIDRDRMQMFIHQGKGKKDRVIPMAISLMPFLDAYLETYKPAEWLFENQERNGPYSSRAAQKVFQDAAERMGLPKSVSFHSLRHSLATHMLENGIDISLIQKLLDHNDNRTTLRYTHVSKRHVKGIENPLDAILRKNRR